MEAFEYAIKKDVRNNPIVREVDEARQRELWKSGGVAALLVLLVLFSAWQHFELLRHGYQVEEMQREKAEQEEVGRQYRLEIDTLRSPRRIEALATEQLHLVRADRRRRDRDRARHPGRSAGAIGGRTPVRSWSRFFTHDKAGGGRTTGARRLARHR